MYSLELKKFDEIIEGAYLNDDSISYNNLPKSLEKQLLQLTSNNDKISYIFFYISLFTFEEVSKEILLKFNSLNNIMLSEISDYLWTHSFFKYRNKDDNLTQYKNNLTEYFSKNSFNDNFNIKSISDLLKNNEKINLKVFENLLWDKKWGFPYLLFLDFYKCLDMLNIYNVKFNYPDDLDRETFKNLFSKFNAITVKRNFQKYEKDFFQLIDYLYNNSNFNWKKWFKENFWYILEDFLCLYK